MHTDVGNQCVAAKVDGRYAPLRAPLTSGQTVEIVTMPWGRPNAAWLDFVVSGKARTAIRNYLKHLRTEEAVELGEMLLGRALAVESIGFDDVPPQVVDTLLEELKLNSIEALYEEMGIGRRLAPMIVETTRARWRGVPRPTTIRFRAPAHRSTSAAPRA